MKTSIMSASLVALMANGANGFTTPSNHPSTTASSTRIAAESDSRRQFFSKGFTYSAAALASTGVLAPLPANASPLDKVNAKLKG